MLKSAIKPILKEAQELADKMYDEQGLTDEVLDLQIEINEIRHKLDIPDKNERIHEEFVQ